MNPRIVHQTVFKTSEVNDIVIIVICGGLSWFFPLPLAGWLPNPLLYTLGVMFLVAVVALIIAAKREFKHNQQFLEPGQETTRLVTTGIFSYSRNPVYLASLLLYGAIGCFFDSGWFFLAIPPGVILFRIRLIAPEEKFLQAEFSEEYTTYTSRVRRWF